MCQGSVVFPGDGDMVGGGVPACRLLQGWGLDRLQCNAGQEEEYKTPSSLFTFFEVTNQPLLCPLAQVFSYRIVQRDVRITEQFDKTATICF